MSGFGREAKRLRFGADDDLALLREFVSQNPLTDSKKWEEIKKNVLAITGKNFSVRTLKDHLFLILDIWLKRDRTNQVRSGVEEIHSERDQLLQEISDLCNNTNVSVLNKKKRTSKEKQIQVLGQKAREDCARTLIKVEMNNNENYALQEHDYFENEVIIGHEEPSDPLIPKPNKLIDSSQPQPSLETPEMEEKRILVPKQTRPNKSAPLKKSALEYLNSKGAREEALKCKELQLEKEKLDLERKRLQLDQERQEMEIIERKEKLEMERTRYTQEMFERNQQSKIIEQQDQLIQTLLSQLKRYEEH